MGNSLICQNPFITIRDAIENDDVEKLKYLLENGYNPNIYQIGDNSDLSLAIHKGNIEIVILMIKYGAKLKNNYSNLTCAYDSKHPHLIEYFMSELNESNIMEVVIDNNDLATADMLMKRGYDVDRVNHDGMTALMYAAEKGNLEFVKIFLKYGAKKDTFMVVKGNERQEIINLLMS